MSDTPNPVKAGRGRPKGARNRLGLRTREKLDEIAPELLEKLMGEVRDGNVKAMSTLALHAFPKPRPAPAPLPHVLPPVLKAEDAAEFSRAVLASLASGDLAPSEAFTMIGALKAHAELALLPDLSSRLTDLEARLANV